MPDLAAGNDPPPAALKGAPLATKVEFDYDLARFISFRDREVCERLQLPFAILSDESFLFTDALSLPTFIAASARLLHHPNVTG